MQKEKIMVYIGGFVTFLIIISFLGAIYPTLSDEGRKIGDYDVFIINETFTAHNSTDGNIEYLTYVPYISSSGYVLNATTYEYISINNFTINTATGLITLSNGATQGLKLNGTSFLISYNYTRESNAIFNAGFGSGGIVYILFAAAVVIGVIVFLLKKKSR
jgi:hypothetical protein